MGLDITAFRKITPIVIGEVVIDGENDPRRIAQVHQKQLDYTEANFPGRVAGLEAGVYEFEDWVSFKAGSYTGYNDWRDTLAMFAYRRTARDLHLDPNIDQMTGPFIELINFSDCEGLIGPDVCRKLANDFALKARAMRDCAARHSAGEWFMEVYRKFAKAFAFAADGGFIKFH